MVFKHTMLSTAALSTLLALTTTSANAAYTDSNAFFAQLSGQANQTLASFPSYTLTTQDSFGISAPMLINSSGQLSGSYGCNSGIYPCSGAYRLTYTLPFAIIGFEGNLQYRQAYGQETPIFSVPLGNSTNINYNGFYGEIFSPTNTITLTWQAGIVSTDDNGGFLLTSASVIPASTAVPEPASLATLGLSIVAFGMLRRKASAKLTRLQCV